MLSGSAIPLRVVLALFGAGFCTFSVLYCVQPLLPVFAQEFHLGAAQSSLSLSATTMVIAFAVLIASPIADSLGHKPVMVASLAGAAVLTVMTAFAPNWPALIALRALTGLALSGFLPAAVAYLAEEMPPQKVGLAVGVYIGGSGVGGMSARIFSGFLSDISSWRLPIAIIGIVSLVTAIFLPFSLPNPKKFVPRPVQLRTSLSAFAQHLCDERLFWLYAAGFLLMGSFVTMFNYVTFRLINPPFSLAQSHLALVFAVYPIGSVGSAWLGNLAARHSREHVLLLAIILMIVGIALTCIPAVPVVILGMAIMTFGFFGAHAIASATVGTRAAFAKAQASSLYLFFYYLGSSLLGSLGGVFWDRGGWNGVMLLVGVPMAIAFVLPFRLAVVERRRAEPTP